MKRSYLVAIWVLALTAYAVVSMLAVTRADEADPPTRRQQISPLEVIPPDAEFRMSDRILFVIDVSGSMREGGKLQQAIQSVHLIAGQGVDDFRVGVLAFSGATTRWDGVTECHGHAELENCGPHCVPFYWASMPSGYQELTAWLNELGAVGDTEASRALEEALHDPEPRLTLVLVTDGVFPTNREDPRLGIQRGQEWRERHELRRAPIMVWGAGAASSQATLREIAREGGGGMWVNGEGVCGPW